MGALNKLMHAWNAFSDEPEPFATNSFSVGPSVFGAGPGRVRRSFSNERSIVAAIYNRIAVDVSANSFRHARVDDEGRFIGELDTGLNDCLSLEANIDQSAAAFLQDIAMTLCDKGYLAVVPVDTTLNPAVSGSFDIKSMRVGEIVSWFPRHVRIRLYDDVRGRHAELTLEKKSVAIIDNPFYTVMNEPNSTLQRLIHKLNLLDAVDEQSASGKLDLIIQLPYVVKTEARRKQALTRREDIEFQLKGSKYGIAYTDGTEKITQLNRPAENNLLSQIEYLVGLLYSQLGITPEVMNGTADESAMLNYHTRTVEPIVDAIRDGFRRAFLTKTARTQKQTILAFRDPFRYVPIGTMAEIGDKFARNEILTSNEIRSFMGIRPHSDPKADKLQNSNMPTAATPQPPAPTPPPPSESVTQKQVNQEGDSHYGSRHR